MVQKQPALIDVPSAVIRRRLDGLSSALMGREGNSGGRRSSNNEQLPATPERWKEAAAKMARRVPVLIASSEHEGSSVLNERLGKLADLMGSGDSTTLTPLDCTGDNRELAVSLVEAEPLLLVLSPSRLRYRLGALPALINLAEGLPAAVLISRKHPWLLTVSERAISRKVEALGESLGVTSRLAQSIARSYPKVLSFSEENIAGKVSALCQAFPVESVREMVCRQPSLLARSSDKVLASLSQLKAVVGVSKERAAGLAERRPSILAKSSASSERCYRALSVWKLAKAEKDEMVQKHPLLLSLSPQELHLRCRWLRSLVISNGYGIFIAILTCWTVHT